jgi:hypothetical protein
MWRAAASPGGQGARRVQGIIAEQKVLVSLTCLEQWKRHHSHKRPVTLLDDSAHSAISCSKQMLFLVITSHQLLSWFCSPQ